MAIGAILLHTAEGALAAAVIAFGKLRARRLARASVDVAVERR